MRSPGTVECYDCSSPVALSAKQCTHCGSREFVGPHIPMRKHARASGLEQRNDRTLATACISLAMIGGCYGFAISGGVFSAILYATTGILCGLAAGVPVGFAVNLMRGDILPVNRLSSKRARLEMPADKDRRRQ